VHWVVVPVELPGAGDSGVEQTGVEDGTVGHEGVAQQVVVEVDGRAEQLQAPHDTERAPVLDCDLRLERWHPVLVGRRARVGVVFPSAPKG
jgi:hypothetical protein